MVKEATNLEPRIEDEYWVIVETESIHITFNLSEFGNKINTRKVKKPISLCAVGTGRPWSVLRASNPNNISNATNGQFFISDPNCINDMKKFVDEPFTRDSSIGG
jgi:hypothetical protein